MSEFFISAIIWSGYFLFYISFVILSWKLVHRSKIVYRYRVRSVSLANSVFPSNISIDLSAWYWYTTSREAWLLFPAAFYRRSLTLHCREKVALKY